MTAISDVIIKMIDFYEGSLHDIDHFMKVYSYAKTIGEQECLEKESQYVLELAAILHDIACPLCREKYGAADGKMQELEGAELTRAFLDEFSIPADICEKLVWLVSHHHTYNDVTMPEHRILLEADFLVNAGESAYSQSQIEKARKNFFRTKCGILLLDSIYMRQEI